MRPTLSPSRLLPLITGLALLGGCHVLRENCNEPQPYETAQVAPPLKVPEGMTAPNTKSSLTIPDVAAPRMKLTSKDACRDAPPPLYTEKGTPST